MLETVLLACELLILFFCLLVSAYTQRLSRQARSEAKRAEEARKRAEEAARPRFPILRPAAPREGRRPERTGGADQDGGRFGRRNPHCSNCGDERGGPFGHEISECQYRRGMTAEADRADAIRLHLRLVHRNESAGNLTDAEAKEQHYLEHNGPCGLRNHDQPPQLHTWLPTPEEAGRDA